jgi:CheY-like chemotaxis protein
MRILVLDDSSERLKIFRKNLIGHTVDCVKTAREAIDMLDTNSFDLVSLDHDLGDKTMVTSGPGTGYEVTEWLGANPDKQPRMIFIHSFNPAGAQRMKLVLANAVVAPGIWTKLAGMIR